MGGAQAIAAFAYGTRTVPRADRIVGPGNIYVAAAKKLLAGEVGIDFVAGPTEILIISADGDPRHLAADMLAQAEHDVDAAAILLTPSKRLANAVAQEIERQLADLPTAAVARQAIGEIAPSWWCGRSMKPWNCEPLRARALSIPDDRLLARVQHAGSVFIGPSQPGSGWGLRLRPQSRAAHQRGGAAARRAFRRRLSESDIRAAPEPWRVGGAGSGDYHAGARRRIGSARALRRGPSCGWAILPGVPSGDAFQAAKPAGKPAARIGRPPSLRPKL